MKRPLAASVAVAAVAATAFSVPAIADTYYYAAGTRQSGKPSQTSADEWRAFLGQDHVPAAYTVQYPRDLAPLIGDKTLNRSANDGMLAALDLVGEYHDGDGVTLVGVSQGAVVMAKTKRALIADTTDGIDPSDITVLTFGDPTNPDGGFLAKLDRWNVSIPGYTPVTNTPGEGAYVTYAIEYDLIADAPDNLNPVSWVNAALGATYDHPAYSKAFTSEAAAEHRIVSNSQEWYQAADDGEPTASYQHNLIKQKNLPLTRPLRDIGTSIADDEGDVAVNRAVDQLDNLLRPVVDAGYDGGQPGGTRHKGTVIEHRPSDAVRAQPRTPAKPLRNAVKAVREAVKQVRDGLRPKDDERRQDSD